MIDSLLIICLDYVLRTSIDKIRENCFELTKKRSRRYPAKTITDADYADDIAILANTPNQAKTLLHSLEQAAAGIGLHVNAHKTEYMCYNQTGDIFTLDGTLLKLVDKFTYLGSSVSSTEKDIDTRLRRCSSPIFFIDLPWLHPSNFYWSIDEGLYVKKGKKTKSSRNYDRRRLCRWSTASFNYTCPSRIQISYPIASIIMYWSLRETEYMC